MYVRPAGGLSGQWVVKKNSTENYVIYREKKANKIQKRLKGASGFEPGTSQSAVECSTTELYPQLLNRTAEIATTMLHEYYSYHVTVTLHTTRSVIDHMTNM